MSRPPENGSPDGGQAIRAKQAGWDVRANFVARYTALPLLGNSQGRGCLMARFTTAKLEPPVAAGVYVARIVKAREKTSEAANQMLVMTARLSTGAEIPFVVTFAASRKSAKLVAYFARSLDLIIPEDEGIEIELLPQDVLDRVFYPQIELDNDGQPRIVQFLSRQEAIAINPQIAEVRLRPQSPRQLRPVNGGLL
jgi:hypothetical protein